METEIVLELKHKKNNPRNSEGSFVTLKNGRILYAYSRYYGKSWNDHATADIGSCYSTDSGRTWSEEDSVIVKNEGGCNVMSVSLLRLQDGRIALFYLRKNSVNDCRLYMRISLDEAETWSKPTLCIPAPGYFIINNDRIIQLQNGRILVPASFHRTQGMRSNYWNNIDSRGIVIFYYSDDSGATWQEAKDWWALPVRSLKGLQEPGIVELKGEQLYCWCRTSIGRQWQLKSCDNGDTWTPPEPSLFISPHSPLSMKRIPKTGDLLAVWNDVSDRWEMPKKKYIDGRVEDSSWGRTPLVTAISKDEGKTWKKEKIIETDPERGFCYTAIHFIDDAVLLAYCCGGKNSVVLQDLCIRRITLDWLYGHG